MGCVEGAKSEAKAKMEQLMECRPQQRLPTKFKVKHVGILGAECPKQKRGKWGSRAMDLIFVLQVG